MLYPKSCPKCGGDVKYLSPKDAPDDYGSSLSCIQCSWTKHEKPGSPMEVRTRRANGKAPIVMSRYVVQENHGYTVL